MWKAHVDIQFIKTAKSAVMYVCSYMMKAKKGMGELLKQVCKEVRRDEIKKNQLKSVGHAFPDSCKVLQQEAAVRILSMPYNQKK